jgi:hypothetical protein
MKQCLENWIVLLQKLHDEVEEAHLKKQINQLISEIEEFLAKVDDIGEDPPTSGKLKKLGTNFSDLLLQIFLRYSEHEIVHFIVGKLQHFL